MARTCSSCNRGYLKAASRSHSNIKTLKRQYVNLQLKTVKGVRTLLCTRCIKKTAIKWIPKTTKTKSHAVVKTK